ncbi:hypothetical protein B0J12DRAFT_340623 [Macrophomina phaseolina]|uniref:Uncharacterized protein n=1 Tax=Macrophomina phaseolina TaxID=35725 RepID=A0ABQ8GLZ6_9PEZI|nr:hypothetical protein B0J12DRAFT_340623 [Macrophomina phaseolina]
MCLSLLAAGLSFLIPTSSPSSSSTRQARAPTQAGVEALMRVWAGELGDAYGIPVNAVKPTRTCIAQRAGARESYGGRKRRVGDGGCGVHDRRDAFLLICSGLAAQQWVDVRRGGVGVVSGSRHPPLRSAVRPASGRVGRPGGRSNTINLRQGHTDWAVGSSASEIPQGPLGALETADSL